MLHPRFRPVAVALVGVACSGPAAPVPVEPPRLASAVEADAAAAPDAAAPPDAAPPPPRPAGLVAELQLDAARRDEIMAVTACGSDTVVSLDGVGQLVRWSLDGRAQILEVRPGVDDARWTARGQMQLSVLHATGQRLFVARRDGVEEIHDLVELDCATGAVRARHRPEVWIYAVGAPAAGAPVVIAHDERLIELAPRPVERRIGRDIVALSPDGERAVVAAARAEGTRELYVRKTRRTRALDTGAYYTNACAFSLEGTHVVCAGPRGVVVNDTDTGARVARVEITSPDFDELVVYPGARLVALVDDRRVDLYTFDGAHHSFATGEDLIRGVAPMTLADGRPALILGGERGVIRVWDIMAAAER